MKAVAETQVNPARHTKEPRRFKVFMEQFTAASLWPYYSPPQKKGLKSYMLGFWRDYATHPSPF